MLGFNPALFDQKQQAHPKAAWSIDEIERVAGKLTATKTDNQYGFGIATSPTRNLAVYMAVRGRPLASLQLADGRLDFTTPAVVTILHEYIDFLQQSVADPLSKQFFYEPLLDLDDVSELASRCDIGAFSSTDCPHHQ